MYESAVVQLLARQEVEGISPTILRAFQESYASTAFRCRFPHCDRLSLGFATAELRLEHEAVHVQRVYCQTSSCPYARIGFATKSALNAHTRKHHSQSYISLIPAKVRRTKDAETESVPIAPITPRQNNPQQQQQMLVQQQQQQQQEAVVVASQQHAPNRPPTAQAQNVNHAASEVPHMIPGLIPNIMPNKSSPGLNITPEQMSKMTPQQQAQIKAQILKAQNALDVATNKTPQQQQQPVQQPQLDIPPFGNIDDPDVGIRLNIRVV
jgi:hypothetical protein